MKRRNALFTLSGLALAPLVPRFVHAQGSPTTLRIALVTPRGSSWHRVFTAWSNTLRTSTNGRLVLDVQPGSGGGDERELVRRLRAGELDGACFTAVGLTQIARSALVLQSPGVVEGYEQLDRVRSRLDAELRGIFEQGGTTLLGWSDFGRGRVFSRRPIQRPADLRETHPWMLPDDPLFGEFLRTVGATGVPLQVGGVMEALNSGAVDTVIASPTAVSGLQWHTRLTHVTSQSNAVLIGATLLAKPRFDALPPDLQQALRDTAARAHTTLQTSVRQADDRYYETLTTRHGMTAVDASAYEAEWRQAAQQTRDRLVGRVFDRALLDRVLAAARS